MPLFPSAIRRGRKNAKKRIVPLLQEETVRAVRRGEGVQVVPKDQGAG